MGLCKDSSEQLPYPVLSRTRVTKDSFTLKQVALSSLRNSIAMEPTHTQQLSKQTRHRGNCPKPFPNLPSQTYLVLCGSTISHIKTTKKYRAQSLFPFHSTAKPTLSISTILCISISLESRLKASKLLKVVEIEIMQTMEVKGKKRILWLCQQRLKTIGREIAEMGSGRGKSAKQRICSE